MISLVLAAALAATTARGESIAVPLDSGGRTVELAGEFAAPPGPGPFAAVILLHGCTGAQGFSQRRAGLWTARLHAMGYATLVLDSFTARGVTTACVDAKAFPPRERVADIYAAALALAGRGDVKADAIAAMGFSHGGAAALDAAAGFPEQAPWRARLAPRGKLAAVIAFYPGCLGLAGQALTIPTLVLAGAEDDWPSAEPCRALASDGVRVKIYPGARHDFDVDMPLRTYLGHRLGYDPAAAADAVVEVEGFLARYLAAPGAVR